MGAGEIREYLTHLAVDKNFASSTQNVAFNALLFLYKHVMGVELPPIEGGSPRPASGSSAIRVFASRSETGYFTNG